MILSDLIARIRVMLDEPTAAQWTDAMLTTWIGDAARDLARASRHFKKFITVTATPHSSTFTLDPSVIAIETAYYTPASGGGMQELTPTHFEEWSNYTSGPGAVSSRPYRFTARGSQPTVEFLCVPAPSDAGTFQLNCAVVPPMPTVPADPVVFPDAWVDALTLYAEYNALRRDRDQRWVEVKGLYDEVRDALIVSPDYLAVSRNVVPNPVTGGYVPQWLAEW